MGEVLIDGYNLIRQTGRLQIQEKRGGLLAGREALLRHLSAYRRATGEAVTVVFDGDEGVGPRSGKQMGVAVVFSQPPRSADDVIMARLQRSHGKRSLRVVSSDRAICRVARQHKISSVSSEAFASEMARRISEGPRTNPTNREPPVPDVDEVAYWEQVFKTQKGMFEDENE